MAWTRSERIVADDGGTFEAKVMVPPTERGPALVLLHEIFGVTSYIEQVAQRLAASGFVVLAPELFWRTEPGVVIEGHDDASLQRAMGLGKGLDVELAVSDLERCMSAVRTLPETAGGTGVIGFCLGGTLAYLLAAASDPACCVSYYGSGVPRAADRLAAVTCPALFHFGAGDPVIPVERLDVLRQGIGERDDVELHVHPLAGHGFDSARDDEANAAAAESAWATTTGFLHRHLAA